MWQDTFSEQALQKSRELIIRAQETIRRAREVLRVSRQVQADRERSGTVKARLRRSSVIAEARLDSKPLAVIAE